MTKRERENKMSEYPVFEILPQRFFGTRSVVAFSFLFSASNKDLFGKRAKRVHLTCALRGGYVRTGLVLEEESAVVRAGVDVARRIRARTVAPIVREGHRSTKGARHGRCLLAEHGVQ